MKHAILHSVDHDTQRHNDSRYFSFVILPIANMEAFRNILDYI